MMMNDKNSTQNQLLIAELTALDPKILGFLTLVGREVAAAQAKHAPLNSFHEAYAVLAEEIDEFWDEVKKRDALRDLPNMLTELVQVAAMGCRTALDGGLLEKDLPTLQAIKTAVATTYYPSASGAGPAEKVNVLLSNEELRATRPPQPQKTPFDFNIYFSGSIAGGMEDGPFYQLIIAHLQSKGRVFTEHLWNADLHANLKQGVYPAGMEYLATDMGTYQQDIKWIEASHLVVAEVSTPSIGVGIEIAHAQSLQIPVICLYREGSPKRISSMVAGNPGVEVVRYCAIEDLLAQLDKELNGLALQYPV